MAYVLSVPSQSPLKRSWSDIPYIRAESPLTDEGSTGTVRHFVVRNMSSTSLGSMPSVPLGSWRKRDENTPPHSSPRLRLNLVEVSDGASSHSRRCSDYFSRKTSYEIEVPPPPPRIYPIDEPNVTEDALEQLHSLQLVASCAPVNLTPDESADSDAGTRYDTPCENLERESTSSIHSATEHPIATGDESLSRKDESEAAPFKRWLDTLRKRHLTQKKSLKPRAERWSLEVSDPVMPRRVSSDHNRTGKQSQHRKSLSTSSMGFVTAVKSASVTLASTSIAPLSRKGGRASQIRSENRSSGLSSTRLSMDSAGVTLNTVLDEAAWLRSIQRHKILEEIISSEESYIEDMKVLVNVYFTLLASVDSVSTQTRHSIHRTVTQILQLHEDLLAELRRAIPAKRSCQAEKIQPSPAEKPKHTRWHSADVIMSRTIGQKTGRKLRHSFDLCRTVTNQHQEAIADTKTAAEVAKVFNHFMKRFFIYEAFAAHTETMTRDASSTYKSIPTWHAYEKGIEALSDHLAAINKREGNGRKGLTLADLLIKPIQRVCKYPLLFLDLCKQTPSCDDPVSHAELERIYFRLQEMTREIDRATDDPKTRKLMEITWLLQDRLKFEDQTMSPAVTLRLLGQVLLCGVLHVAFETAERIKGQYLACILYKSCLVLATTNRSQTSYEVVAGINLANGSIEEPGNGRGLQCHTAPFTWKLVFESGHRLYEVIMSACSAREEEEWKSHLRRRIAAETRDLSDGRSTTHDLFPTLDMNLKSIGSVFGQPESFARRMSIRRAATLGPKSNLHQVIIKNTQAQKSTDDCQATSSVLVARSQSLLSTGHIPTLAPRRAERARLEEALKDVWTKDILPFPGMGSRRPENPIRASANSVMRKLSMASITSNFSKRSASYTSISTSRTEESQSFARRPAPPHRQPTSEKRRPPQVVDFHTAPQAFLPADFELQQRRDTRHRRMSFRGAMSEKPRLAPLRWESTEHLERKDSTQPTVSTKVSRPSIAGLDGNVETGTRLAWIKREREKSTPGTETPSLGALSVDSIPTDATQKKHPSKSRSRLFKFWA